MILMDRESGILPTPGTANRAQVTQRLSLPAFTWQAVRSTRTWQLLCRTSVRDLGRVRENLCDRASVLVGASQFAAFCARIGAPAKRARDIFGNYSIPIRLMPFLTQEVAFDARALAEAVA